MEVAAPPDSKTSFPQRMQYQRDDNKRDGDFNQALHNAGARRKQDEAITRLAHEASSDDDPAMHRHFPADRQKVRCLTRHGDGRDTWADSGA